MSYVCVMTDMEDLDPWDRPVAYGPFSSRSDAEMFARTIERSRLREFAVMELVDVHHGAAS